MFKASVEYLLWFLIAIMFHCRILTCTDIDLTVKTPPLLTHFSTQRWHIHYTDWRWRDWSCRERWRRHYIWGYRGKEMAWCNENSFYVTSQWRSWRAWTWTAYQIWRSISEWWRCVWCRHGGVHVSKVSW